MEKTLICSYTVLIAAGANLKKNKRKENTLKNMASNSLKRGSFPFEGIVIFQN